MNAGDNIDNFQLMLKGLVASNFNINLVGINGCGKTQIVKENYLELFNNLGIYFTVSDFLSKEILFRKFKEFLLNLLNDKIIRVTSSLEMIGKYFLDSFKFLKSQKSDMSLLNSLKEAWNNYRDLSERLKITAGGFKNFFQIFEYFKEFFEICKNLNKARTNSEFYDKKKNKNGKSYSHYLNSNLFHDKKAYIVIDGIDDIKYLQASQGSIHKYFNKIAAICNNFDIKLLLISNFDLKASELNSPQSANAFDYTEFVTLIFPKYNREEYIKILNRPQAALYSLNDGVDYCSINEQIMNVSVGNYIESIANFNSYIYNIHEMREELGKSPIKTIIRSQLSTAYIKHDNSYSPIQDDGSTSTNSVKSAKQVGYIENISYDCDINRLSPCQKVLLVCAFLASETDAKHDDKLFVNAKRTNLTTRVKSSSHRESKLKKCINAGNAFDIHRLIAIYSSIICILNASVLRQCELNLELISDVNTLVTYNLIKSLNCKVNPDRNFFLDLSRKFRCNINVEFVMLLAGGIGIALDDFVNFDYLNA